ncbi:MAG: ATP-binding protein [Spirulina sp. SIO3F2]|nr:ATP-binding protein [Spirulina sp. SIO3F2]
MHKIIYVLRGLPGSGKTSLAETIKASAGGIMLSSDDYPERYLSDGRLNPRIAVPAAHEWFWRRLRELVLEGIQVIILHNVFHLGEHFLPIFALAKMRGYVVHTIHCEEFAHSSGEVARSTKAVPEELIQQWESEWESIVSIRKKQSFQAKALDELVQLGQEMGMY